jgi:serine phosphatase RsbU (regulator of sigma subunit)/anti-sigma regulatory factor (Ser/Thr protein kinase)
MSEALWTTRPRPRLASPESSVWRGEPTTLAELRAMRMQLRELPRASGRPPGAASDDVDRLLLAFEELVSNALRHGRGPVRAEVTTTASGWLLEVSDAAGESPPVPAVDRDAALGGLGLYLVAQLSAAHGWTVDDEGRKVVWARVDVEGAVGDGPRARPAPGGPRSLPASATVPAQERDPGPAAEPGRRRRTRRAPRRFSVVVTAVVLALAIGLSWLASVVNARNSERLLHQQVVQVSTLLTTQLAIIQTQMSDAGQVAVATGGQPGPFTRFANATVAAPGMSLSLWRVSGDQAQRLAVHGPDPQLPPGGPASFFATLQPTGQLTVAGIIQAPEPRLAYALMPPGDSGGLVVYAETPLSRRVSVEAGDAFGGLDLAAYLGRRPVADQLIQTTAPLPIRGDTATVQVPFANTSFTIVAASRTGLAGPLSAALPWIVLGVGGALALAVGATVETLSRRRAVAEALASDNQRLYQEQRSIAGTLQHALLPEVPSVAGVEVAARYVAGVDELEVGGDWYDVITRPSGSCVFVVGDVSGQGLPAATTMAALRFAVRAYLAQDDDIATVLTKLRELLDITVDHQFATVLLGELDQATGVVRLVSAGHFAPLLLSGGRAEMLECPVAPPVGVATSAAPAVAELRVSGPATLLAFTDGAVERRGEVIDTGLERLRATAAAAGDQPLPTVLDRLMDATTADGGRDDTVILGLRWTTPV